MAEEREYVDPADFEVDKRQERRVRRIEKEIREAAVTGDAMRYFTACNKWGFELLDDSLYMQGRDQYEAEQEIKRLKQERSGLEGQASEPMSSPSPEPIRGRDYVGFLESARSIGFETDTFSYTSTKLGALRKLGYKSLGALGPLGDLDTEDPRSQVAIHGAYQGAIKRALKEISEED